MGGFANSWWLTVGSSVGSRFFSVVDFVPLASHTVVVVVVVVVVVTICPVLGFVRVSRFMVGLRYDAGVSSPWFGVVDSSPVVVSELLGSLLPYVESPVLERSPVSAPLPLSPCLGVKSVFHLERPSFS